MTFIPVEKLPHKYTRKDAAYCNMKPTQSYIKEFLKMNVKYARVDLTDSDYSYHESAYRTIRDSVRRSALPVTAVQRGGHIYLINRNLEDPNEQL